MIIKSKPNSLPIWVYVFLGVVCFVSIFPFFWMAVAATNRSIDIIGGRLFFGTNLIENMRNLFTDARRVDLALWNSLRNTVVAVGLSLFVCSMAGYGFQIYRDKKKDRLMAVLLLSMMVPFATLMIPLFRMFATMGLMNTTLGFVLPSISTAFLIFFFRQCSASFPMEIVQAARVDGLGEFGIYAKVYFPIMAPTFAAAAIVAFMNNWNSYLWPLIILRAAHSRTMPLVVSGIIDGYVTDYGILMLAVTIFSLPTVLLFITQQKRFVAGILGAVK